MLLINDPRFIDDQNLIRHNSGRSVNQLKVAALSISLSLTVLETTVLS